METLDSPFSGMKTYNVAHVNFGMWIMDTGATDHKIADFSLLKNVKTDVSNMIVNLPTGATAIVTHLGDVFLNNGLKLPNVLYIPVFSHNL